MSYQERRRAIIETVQMRPAASHYADRVRKVVVLLSAPRGGSSVVKSVLARNRHFAALLGEHEPFFRLTGNTYPDRADDSLTGAGLTQRGLLLKLLFGDMTVAGGRNHDSTQLLWARRHPLQLAGTPPYMNYHGPDRLALEHAYGPRAVYWDCVDGLPLRDFCAEADSVIETPPFVHVGDRHLLPPGEAADRVLLFKSPQDAYRVGVYEHLFPKADVLYVHLTRGFAQSVNGLMDGWLYPAGFQSHDLRLDGAGLSIVGYDNDRWWNFDAFPGWRGYPASALHIVALAQWRESHTAILQAAEGRNMVHVRFEDFMRDPQAIVDRICEAAGVPTADAGRPPVKMATAQPRRYRWRKRADVIERLAQRVDVQELMSTLGYTMDQESWV